MLGWICFILIVSGTVCGIFTGNLERISAAILSSPAETVTLLLKIGGAICFFSGLLRVAEGAGLVNSFSQILAKPVGALIPQTKSHSALRTSVTMNLASNFFGLGNAATPYGIRAAEQMEQGRVTRSLATFILLNTCSVQLIPTTICALRQANGAKNPMDILPAVWVVQVLSCATGILLTKLAFRGTK